MFTPTFHIKQLNTRCYHIQSCLKVFSRSTIRNWKMTDLKPFKRTNENPRLYPNTCVDTGRGSRDLWVVFLRAPPSRRWRWSICRPWVSDTRNVRPSLMCPCVRWSQLVCILKSDNIEIRIFIVFIINWTIY